MKKPLAVLTLATLSAPFALASDYQFDVSGTIVNENSDYFSDSTVIGAGIQYHFEAVDTSTGPLAEAAFLNKSSNVSAVQLFSNSDDFDYNVTIVSGEFYIPNSLFYLRGDVAHFSGDGNSDSTWVATAGITPIDGMLVTTSYNEDIDYEPNLAAKYVFPLSGDNTLALSGGIELSDDWGDTFSAGADYYFNTKTSVGFTVSDDDFDTSTELRANHFFTDDAYAGVSWSSYDGADAIGLNAGFRF